MSAAQFQELIDGLGRSAVSEILGADVETLEKWASADTGLPEKEHACTQATHRVYSLIKSVDDSDVARTWLLGQNPDFQDASPFEVLAQGRSREVLAAARAYANQM
ncbi:hypothetical protein [Nesterenkonia populi]